MPFLILILQQSGFEFFLVLVLFELTSYLFVALRLLRRWWRFCRRRVVKGLVECVREQARSTEEGVALPAVAFELGY